MCRSFIRDCLWDQDLWKGAEAGRTEVEVKLHCRPNYSHSWPPCRILDLEWPFRVSQIGLKCLSLDNPLSFSHCCPEKALWTWLRWLSSADIDSCRPSAISTSSSKVISHSAGYLGSTPRCSSQPLRSFERALPFLLVPKEQWMLWSRGVKAYHYM